MTRQRFQPTPRVRAARLDALDWLSSVLGARLAVSRQTVNAIETEKYDRSLPLAFRIARQFEKRIEDLFEPGRD